MAVQKLSPATRTLEVKYAIRDIVALANKVAKGGKEMFYLNIGDPNVYDWATPPHIIEAIHKAMKDNHNGYAPSSGIAPAIDSIRRDADRKGIKNILDIFITHGASEAIELCLAALLNEGDNFLMPTPGYPLYTAVQSKLMLQANPYYLDEANGWEPDIEDIRAKVNDKTKAIVLINPNNPTGCITKKETLEKIIEIALEHNLLVIADEIYDKILFDDNKLVSLAALNQDVSCITFSGLSKNFVAPGFRLGWGVASGRQEVMGDYLEGLNKLLRARVSANHPIMYAIPAALDGDQSHLPAMTEILMRRRQIAVDACAGIDGIEMVCPEGAFYAFPSIDVKDDTHFCQELLKETGVLVVPGSGFGQKPGSHHFRIVILPQDEVIRKAFAHIKDFYSDYRTKM
ncbi:MAG: aminotransferase [Bacteroidetes bacterium 4572_77]|nr:MAG: aminotransferase [Bacteroidetes bacterium 4572_77]